MLDLKKKQVELMKVECAKAEMEMRIFEHEENIKRMKENIELQEKRMLELGEEIKELTK